MNVSAYSEESGFMDYDGNMDSSICSINSSVFTSSITLSPVKEATEPHMKIEAPALFMESPENRTGSKTSSNTVIKMSLPDSHILIPKPIKVIKRSLSDF
jgi:hypothetical protein